MPVIVIYYLDFLPYTNIVSDRIYIFSFSIGDKNTEYAMVVLTPPELP